MGEGLAYSCSFSVERQPSSPNGNNRCAVSRFEARKRNM